MGIAKVGVIEKGRAPLDLRDLDQFEEPIGVREPAAYQKRTFILYDRAFEAQTAGDGADAAFQAELLKIPVAHFHIQHRGEATAELGGNIPLVQLHTIDQVGIEGAEKT